MVQQVAPGLFLSDQGVSDLTGPGGSVGSFPYMPRNLKTGRYRPYSGADGAVPVFNESDFVQINGEIVIAVPITSIQVLTALAIPRNYLGFRNSSPAAIANIFIAFGTPASTNSWLRVTPNTIVLLDARIPQDDVYAIADAAGGQLTIVQSSTPGSV